MSQLNPLALNFELHPRQGDALISKATELLYGGAAGGGKSHLSRVMAILWAIEIPGLQIYFFRRLYDDLKKNHIEGPTGFVAMLAPWINAKHPKSKLTGGKLAEVVDGEIRFWNGSKIFLCHLQHQKDLTKYYGPEFHVLFIEEATQFTEFMIRFLCSRLRIPDTLKIPDKYLKPKEEWRDSSVPDYYFPRVIYTSNPGGVGHGYLKRSFFTGFEPYQLHKSESQDGGRVRCYIPAKVDDNPSVNREEYKATLAGLPPALVDALLNGNWDAVIGAYFPTLSIPTHVIKPFPIPEHWTRFMAMDWGACGEGDPFSCGWYAVSDGSLSRFRRNDVICYRRWNGKGLPKVTASIIAEGILKREINERITYRVAGGDITQERGGGGPTVFETFSQNGVHFNRADMRRVSGWQEMQERIIGKDGRPGSYWFLDCVDDIETIGTLQHDLNDPNDIAAGDDHDADRHRYAMMSRPWAKDKPIGEMSPEEKQKALVQNFKEPTINELWERRDKMLKRARR